MSTDEQQTRGGFVPVGQMAARLPGIDGRTRSMSANTRNHFAGARDASARRAAGPRRTGG